jgi:hypothetical protein
MPVWQWNGSAWVQIGGGGGSGSGAASSITFAPGGSISATDVQAAILELDTEKAPVASPTFTGDPKAPTPTAGDNDTSIATTAFVVAAVAAGGGAAPSNTNPLIDGTAAPGTSVLYARGDHVHPTDTTRAALTQVVRYDAAQTLTAAQQKQARANIAVNDGNIVINGDFRINQTGYVSAAVLATGAYGHDQWKAGAGGGDYSFTQLKSSTQITIASGKSIIQPIEDVNVVGGSYALSWTGTASARIGLNNLAPTGSYTSSPLLVSGQTAGVGMFIEFNNGTLGTVKLESGANATPFVMRPYDQELMACKRYWQKLGGTQPADIYLRGYQSAGLAIYQPLTYPVEMRGLPTAAVVGTWTTANATGVVIGGAGTRSLSFGITIGSLGDASAYTTNTTCFISLDARL